MGWPVILTDQSNMTCAIVVFIARDDREAARRFGNQLIDQALSIGKFPEMGRMVPEVGDPAVRSFTALTGSFTSFFASRTPFSFFAFGMRRAELPKSEAPKSR